MILPLHILIAVASILCTTYTWLRPTSSRLQTTAVLFVMTLATGIYLVWSTPTHMVQTCLTGLAYFALTSVGIASTRKKLAQEGN